MKFYVNTAMCELESNCGKDEAEMLLQGARKVDLDDYPKLKYLYRAGIGSENMPVKQIEERKIKVWYPPVSVREEISKAVAELTMSFVLHSNTMANCDFDSWKRVKRPSLGGVKVLVIGNGNIGSLVSRMIPSDRVMVYDIKSSMPTELEDKMRAADVVTVHIPSACINYGTVVAFNEGFIDEEKLGWMKSGSTLINTSRGDIVDEVAVLQWLMKDKGCKYYADTFCTEPYDGVFDGCDNFYGTPHLASYTTRVVQSNTDFALALMRVLDGEVDEDSVSEG